VAEVAQTGRLATAVTEAAIDGEALLQASDRFLIAPQELVDTTEVVQACGLAAAVAESSADGQAGLVTVDRLLMAAKVFVSDTELVRRRCGPQVRQDRGQAAGCASRE
jgi:hypothetical protein